MQAEWRGVLHRHAASVEWSTNDPLQQPLAVVTTSCCGASSLSAVRLARHSEGVLGLETHWLPSLATDCYSFGLKQLQCRCDQLLNMDLTRCCVPSQLSAGEAGSFAQG